MKIDVSDTKVQMGSKAAEFTARHIRETIRKNGSANIIVATGASQFETLEALIKEKDIAWDKVTAFHLDEYVGTPITHPASFRVYLWKRFVSQLDLPLKAFHYVNGDAPNPKEECKRLSEIIARHPIDIALVGIGENAHLAFNDPPADFDTQEAYLVVDLDEDCRKQQLGEGWFPDLNAVPKQAISMGIQQILKSKIIVVSCPDERKATAVQGSVEGPITNTVPSSIMQQHADTVLFLDKASASKLTK
ncbi:MAG: glucosamine-6-phosphate deaminase [Chthoniobacterales bacterium]